MAENHHHRPCDPHRGPRQDHHPPGRQREGRRHALPRHAGARLREVHRGTALLRDAVHHGAHLRHLPGQPPAGIGQGLRRHHGGADSGAGAPAARTAALRAVRAVPRAELLPSLGARPAAGHGLRPGAAQRPRA